MVMGFRKDWQKAKDAYFKDPAANDVPRHIALMLVEGRGFGPDLQAFENADTFEKRQKALAPIMQMTDYYIGHFKKAMADTDTPKGRKLLKDMIECVEGIWEDAETLAKPPHPTSVYLKAQTIRNFDLIQGFKPRALKLDPVMISVTVEVDKAFKKLVDEGKEGAKIEMLGKAAQRAVERLRRDFIETVKKIDDALSDDPLEIAAKTKEAKEVLAHYGRLAEDKVHEAVQEKWAEIKSRRADLKDFKVKTAVKIVLGSVGVGIAIASVVLSFGTAWINIIAACKGILEVGKAIKSATEGIDKVYKDLASGLNTLNELNKKRAKARAAGEGQKASKALVFGKELVAAALPFTKDMVKSVSGMEAKLKQYNGLISKLEDQIDELSGRVEQITANLNSSPNRLLSTEQINLNRRMDKTVKGLFAQVAGLNADVEAHVTFAEEMGKAIKQLKAHDTWLAKVDPAVSMGNRGVAIYGLTNFAFACATAGKQLLSLVPV